VGEMGNIYMIVFRKHKAQTEIGKTRRKGDNNIEMDFNP
jgi:hypothetical protein